MNLLFDDDNRHSREYIVQTFIIRLHVNRQHGFAYTENFTIHCALIISILQRAYYVTREVPGPLFAKCERNHYSSISEITLIHHPVA